ncbi:hypothetical protein OESDEN_05718 [Oesophagostomum dentatum]|uniref:ZP domain-containing protein n=1 Tax=Oesophagostomum dentatum TaxID=61180 RepID=A0A0B1TG11_OESDE|nr:hypothetical protein OESDEN_05718 [Oesophagostomum dentatum]
MMIAVMMIAVMMTVIAIVASILALSMLCTAESALLHSPSYASFLRAASVGWLSIRQAGVDELLISCHITLCHVCDENCREYTPPRSCRDSAGKNYAQMWNESSAVERACSPPVETTMADLLNNSDHRIVFCFAENKVLSHVPTS